MTPGTVDEYYVHVYPKKGKYAACVKVVDTFGSDTRITVPVEV